MTRRKGLVLDANILLRAVFGQRVRELLEAFEDTVIFYSPDVAPPSTLAFLSLQVEILHWRQDSPSMKRDSFRAKSW